MKISSLTYKFLHRPQVTDLILYSPPPVPTDLPHPVPTDLPYPVSTDLPYPVPTDLPYPVPTDLPYPVPTDLPYPVPPELTSAVLTTPLQPLCSVPMYRVPQVAVTRQLHRQLPEPGPDAGGRVPHPAARPAAQLGGGALHLGGRGALDQRLRVGGALDERVRFLKRQPGIDRPARQPV